MYLDGDCLAGAGFVRIVGDEHCEAAGTASRRSRTSGRAGANFSSTVMARLLTSAVAGLWPWLWHCAMALDMAFVGLGLWPGFMDLVLWCWAPGWCMVLALALCSGLALALVFGLALGDGFHTNEQVERSEGRS